MLVVQISELHFLQKKMLNMFGKHLMLEHDSFWRNGVRNKGHSNVQG